MRLIDGHRLKKVVYEHKTARLTKETVLKLIDDCLPIDAVPVVYGKWEDYSYFWKKCSHCGLVIHEQWTISRLCHYCPNCGAKMDVKEVGHERD